MLNLVADDRDTLFIDLDGTLVLHNYDPEKLEDVIIESTFDWVMSLKNTSVIITTSRTFDHAKLAVKKLEDRGMSINLTLCNLPTGKRTIVNDSHDSTEKAIAVNLERNKGYGA